MDYEQLGTFYLGHRYDLATAAVTAEPILYDAKDLTTHGVIVGMTGSGKTGLCVSILEEAAIDGVPAIVIDPKGDLGNLLLTFPSLSPADFEPWVDPGEAARRGQTVGQLATGVASWWREGIGRWGQDGTRIQRLRDAVELAMYTPGSEAGRPLSVLRSLAAPEGVDADALRDRVATTVSSLLTLVGEDADPVQSRAHVFLSHVVHLAWSRGESVSLGGLVREVMQPSFTRLGVLELDTFLPPRERQQLAMRLNALVASPTFAPWLTGEPLDVQRLLWREDGKPRVSVLSLAHLGDAERMFFVTLLLEELIGWMRRQPGTGSLRALLCMDEVAGFLPPVAAPPSKQPFLTLLKQARAYGVGLLLATQNPVDVDYKALSNCGTWWLGRLQTERDVARVADGLATAGGTGMDPATLQRTLAAVPGRVFVMHDVHEEAPVLMHTRWTLSYLRGPLTRSEVTLLAQPPQDASPQDASPQDSRPADQTGGQPAEQREGAFPADIPPAQAMRPVVDAAVEEVFLGDPAGDVRYVPMLLGTVEIAFQRSRPPVDEVVTRSFLAPLSDDRPAALWRKGRELSSVPTRGAPVEEAGFAELPAGFGAKSMAGAEKALVKHAAKTARLTLLHCKELDLRADPGESHDVFAARCHQALREGRDRQVGEVKASFEKRHAALMKKIRAAERKLAKEQGQAQQKQIDTAVSVGTTVLGAIFGRRTTVTGHAGRAATAARRGAAVGREKQDVAYAERDLQALEAELAALDEELTWALTEAKADAAELPPITEQSVRPSRGGIEVLRLALAWAPRLG